jgi:uncharacterized protein (TIGR03118 family)
MAHGRRSRVVVTCLSLLLVLLAAPSASQAGFVQTNLVSDIPGLAAHTDANLKNPWGISFSLTSPFWVSNQVTGTATLYAGDGTPRPATPLIVDIPGGNPTGQVFNSTDDFHLSTGSKAFFLFATLNGTIAGWGPPLGTSAEIVATTAGAVYTGLALANNGTGNFLYAANGEAATIDVFNGGFSLVTLGGSFTDPTLPAGFTPYNVQNIGGTLYVTYENEEEGGGVVDAFDTNGGFLRRISANAGPLASPWGLALAPAGFGEFGGALLVGNEDDGHISAFNPTTGAFLGQLEDGAGNPIANTGLWGLAFGNGANGFDPGTLYFAAGINEEVDGLFGAIAPAAAEPGVPEPASIMLLGLGMLAVGGWNLLRRTRPA